MIVTVSDIECVHRLCLNYNCKRGCVWHVVQQQFLPPYHLVQINWFLKVQLFFTFLLHEHVIKQAFVIVM